MALVLALVAGVLSGVRAVPAAAAAHVSHSGLLASLQGRAAASSRVQSMSDRQASPAASGSTTAETPQGPMLTTTSGGWQDGGQSLTVVDASMGRTPALDPLKLYVVNSRASVLVPAGLRPDRCSPAVRGALPAGGMAVCAASSTVAGAAAGAVVVRADATGATVQVGSGAQVAVTAAAYAFDNRSPVVLLTRSGQAGYVEVASDSSWAANAFLSGLLRRQDPPAAVVAVGATTDREVSSQGRQVYAVSSASVVTGGAARTATADCPAPCFEFTARGATYRMSVGDNLVTVASDASGQRPVRDVALGYTFLSRTTTQAFAPLMVLRAGSGSPDVFAVPVGSAAGRALRFGWYLPSYSALFAGTTMSGAQVHHAVAQGGTSTGGQTKTSVSSAMFAYLTGTLHLPADQYEVKDQYTQAELPQTVPVQLGDLSARLTSGFRNYRFEPTATQGWVSWNAAVQSQVRAVALGYYHVQGAGQWATFKPVLAVQLPNFPVLLVDLTDAGQAGLLGRMLSGPLGRTVTVTGDYYSGQQIAADTDPTVPWTFLGSQPSSGVFVPADRLSGNQFSGHLYLPAGTVVRTGYGWYQQVADPNAAVPQPVGAPVRTVWVRTDKGHLVLFAYDANKSEFVSGLSQAFTGVLMQGVAARQTSQKGLGALNEVYTFAATRQQLGTGPRSDFLYGMQAKAIMQSGHTFPFDNGGRNVLTPTEAAELFRGGRADELITSSLKSAVVQTDLQTITAERAGLAVLGELNSADQQFTLGANAGRDVTLAAPPGSASVGPMDRAMAWTATFWVLDELMVTDSAQRFGSTTDVLTDRLTKAFPDSTAAQRTTALRNTFLLLGIDNATFRANGGNYEQVGLRYVLDPNPGPSAALACDDAGDTAALSYGGLVASMRSCRAVWNQPPAADSAMAGSTTQARLSYWSGWAHKRGDAIRAAGITYPAGPESRLAQQLIASNAAAFQDWAHGLTGLDTITGRLTDNVGDLGALLAKINPALQNAVTVMLNANIAANRIQRLTYGDLTSDQLDDAAHVAVSQWLFTVGLLMRAGSLGVDEYDLLARYFSVVQIDGIARSIAQLFGRNPQVTVTDPVQAADILHRQWLAVVGADGPSADLVNRLGLFGTVAGLMAVAALGYQLKDGIHDWQDAVAVAEEVTLLLSTAGDLAKVGYATAARFGFMDFAPGKVQADSNKRALDQLVTSITEKLLDDRDNFTEDFVRSQILRFGFLEQQFRNFSVADNLAWRAVLAYRDFVRQPAAADPAADSELLNAVTESTLSEMSESSTAQSLIRDLAPRTQVMQDGITVSEKGFTAGWRFDDESVRKWGELVRFFRPSGVASDEVTSARIRYASLDILESLMSLGAQPRVAQTDMVSDLTASSESGGSDAVGDGSSRSELRSAEDKALSSVMAREALRGTELERFADLRIALTPTVFETAKWLLKRSKAMTAARAVGRILAVGLVGVDVAAGLLEVGMAIAGFVLDKGDPQALAADALNFVSGVALLTAGILMAAGVLTLVAALPLIIVGVVLMVVALLVELLKKKHPEKDNDALADWIQPYVSRGLTSFWGVWELQYWHSHSQGQQVSWPHCEQATEWTGCSFPTGSSKYTPFFRLQQVSSGKCVGLPGGGRQPAVYGCDDPGQVTRPESTNSLVGWQIIPRTQSSEVVVWGRYWNGSNDFDARCIADEQCHYDRGDGGTKGHSPWQVSAKYADGSVTLQRTDTKQCLTTASDGRTLTTGSCTGEDARWKMVGAPQWMLDQLQPANG